MRLERGKLGIKYGLYRVGYVSRDKFTARIGIYLVDLLGSHMGDINALGLIMSIVT